jgi:hypothetical protein
MLGSKYNTSLISTSNLKQIARNSFGRESELCNNVELRVSLVNFLQAMKRTLQTRENVKHFTIRVFNTFCFSWQQFFRERAAVLHYTWIVGRSCHCRVRVRVSCLAQCREREALTLWRRNSWTVCVWRVIVSRLRRHWKHPMAFLCIMLRCHIIWCPIVFCICSVETAI